MRKTLGLICLLSSFSFSANDAQAITPEEGFLYSVVGCTNAFKRSDQEDKTDAMINLVHAYSAEKSINSVQPGYITRFIKIVERKWKDDYELAKTNCDGIYELALKESKPETYNRVAQSVVQFMLDLEAKGKNPQGSVQPK